ncbi:hypothetical protein C8A00DRAFT_13030 [Chaetomidium leptoderma]|uniref:Uncharacterized protein n=1 Tax=Chaetomidium leptoderma TaxID=669021 RepID=A0AAN6VRD2_9PEZI|nr:hypothetical protein C8A00DRAFT_13030 [Chaetomidium leptoderma]
MVGRPPGKVGRAQLKSDDLVRIQTLYHDARMGPTQIHKVTGYSIHQIKYALKKKTPTIGKRTGRPRKGESAGKKGGGKESGEGEAVGEDEGEGEGESEEEGEEDVAMEELVRLQLPFCRGVQV